MKLWVSAVAVAAVLTVGGLPALTLALADDPTPSTPATRGEATTADPTGRGLGACRHGDREPGPPPWAGKELTKPEKQRLKDEHKADRRSRHQECKAVQKQTKPKS